MPGFDSAVQDMPGLFVRELGSPSRSTALSVRAARALGARFPLGPPTRRLDGAPELPLIGAGGPLAAVRAAGVMPAIDGQCFLFGRLSGRCGPLGPFPGGRIGVVQMESPLFRCAAEDAVARGGTHYRPALSPSGSTCFVDLLLAMVEWS